MASFIILKPEALESKHVGRIISRFEDKGYTVSNISSATVKSDLIAEHYAEHKDKDFYDSLCKQFENKRVIIFTVTSDYMLASDVVKSVRTLIGNVSTPGTIRGDFSRSFSLNAIHASDSDESAKREIELWYSSIS